MRGYAVDRMWIVAALAVAVASSFGEVTDPFAYVRSELAKGGRIVCVPKAKYVVEPVGAIYLALTNVSDAVIDFSGSEVVGKVATRLIQLVDCTNVTVKNLTVDFEPLPYTEGEILEVSGDGDWTVRVFDGYPRPEGRQLDSSGIFPVQVYGRKSSELVNPARFGNGLQIVRAGDGLYHVSGGGDRRGTVGDICVWTVPRADRPTEPYCLNVARVTRCTFENITLYSTCGMGFLESFACSNVWRKCSVDRRPPETDPIPRGWPRLRSGNHDAFNSRSSVAGPRLENCTFRYHGDDCVNISGMYALVSAVHEDGSLRVLYRPGRPPFSVPDTAEALTADAVMQSGLAVRSCVADGVADERERRFVESLGFWPGVASEYNRAYRVTLERPVVGMGPGGLVASEHSLGNGFSICGCTLGPCRGRGVFFLASHGCVRDCRIRGTYNAGILSWVDYVWLESGTSHDVELSGNDISGVDGWGIEIGGESRGGKLFARTAHREIRVVKNRIADCTAGGLEFVGCEGVVLTGNTLSVSGRYGPLRLLNASLASRDGLRLSPFVVSGMTMPCGVPVPVAGEAVPGTRVTVTLGGQRESAMTDASGKWKVTLRPMAASDRRQRLEVWETDADTGRVLAMETIVDVLVGASGQRSSRAD